MRNATTRRWMVGTAVPILAALGLYGCKDTLTEAAAPQGALSGQAVATLTGVEGSLIAAYRSLDYTSSVGGNAWADAASDWVWASVTSDDAYKGSVDSDQPPATDIELYQWSTANTDGYLNDRWRGVYEGVSRANAALTNLKQLQTAGGITAADAALIAGEAIFLRAHYHFSAWRMWGNIPYYREDDTDFRKANEPSAQVVADIIKDLDSAAVLLPATPRGGDRGRVTSWAAKAYKGRVQAYAGQWAPALATLRDVQASGPYQLEDSYDRVWTAIPTTLASDKEAILAYQASVNDGDPNGSNANWGERLNFPHSGSPFGCCGFHQPSQNLVNFFAVDPTTGLPAALTNANWNANNDNFVAGSATPVDPRLDWTVGRDGVPYKDWPSEPKHNGYPNETWNRDRSYGGPYQPKKNIQEFSSGATSNVGWTPTQLNAVRMHIFRYADMLLLLAEAEVEAGSLENARTIVNLIRARAGQKVQGPGTSAATLAVPINDPSITWATYKVGLYTTPFAGQDEARTAVRYERRLELAMEGQRFFDLKRWHIAQQTLNDYLAVEKTRRSYLSAASPFVARDTLFPIPSTQIRLSQVGSASTLTQNPGW